MNALSAPPVESTPGAPSWFFYYGWVNLVLASAAMVATFPGRTFGLAMINLPLQKDLGINNVFQGQLNFWSVLLGAALCWPIGRLLDWLGTRIVLTAVIAGLGGTVVWMAHVTGRTDLFISMTLSRGLGQGALSLASMALVGKWFHRRIGIAMGVFSVLLAFGFMGTFVGIGTGVKVYGWRATWEALGLVLLCGLAPLCLLLVRSLPEGTSLADPREYYSKEEAAAHSAMAATMWEALRSPAFWILTLAASLFNLIISGLTFFGEDLFLEQGLDHDTFTLWQTVMALGGIVFNLLGGWLSRSGSLGRLLAIGMVLLAAAVAMFPFVHSNGGIVAFGLVFGASGGIITVVFFAMYNALYGRRNLGQIQGVAQVMTVFASAAGPWLVAIFRERTHGLALLLEVTAGLSVAFALGCWWVPTVRRGDIAVIG